VPVLQIKPITIGGGSGGGSSTGCPTGTHLEMVLGNCSTTDSYSNGTETVTTVCTYVWACVQ
jgi:hypothetical protein